MVSTVVKTDVKIAETTATTGGKIAATKQEQRDLSVNLTRYG